MSEPTGPRHEDLQPPEEPDLTPEEYLEHELSTQKREPFSHPCPTCGEVEEIYLYRDAVRCGNCDYIIHRDFFPFIKTLIETVYYADSE